MNVKVISIEYIKPKEKIYLPFKWVCKACEKENDGEVLESHLIIAKMKHVEPINHRETCQHCGAEHVIKVMLK